MAVTYTTVAIVKKRVNPYNPNLFDEDIEENIMQAEGVIDAAMKKTARGSSPDFTFDADKHGIIRDCATNYAAYSSVLHAASETYTYNVHRSILEELRQNVESSLIALSDHKIVSYLASM